MEENITKGTGKVILRIFDKYFEFENISQCINNYLHIPYKQYKYLKDYNRWPCWWQIYKRNELPDDITISDISLLIDIK